VVFGDQAVKVVLAFKGQMPRVERSAGAVSGSPVPVVAELSRVLGAAIEHQLDLASGAGFFGLLLDGVIIDKHDAVGWPDGL
jgi:hypothetical protein